MTNNQEQLLTETLQKASQIVEAVEDRYREVAFPIILQTLMHIAEVQDITNGSTQRAFSTQAAEHLLPSTMSVNEFFRRANPDTHPARFITAAYYLLHTGNAEQFNQTDIVEIYRKLRQPLPKNPTDVVNQCIRKAYVTDASTKDRQKCWTITPDGEKYVEGLLNGNNNGSNTIIG